MSEDQTVDVDVADTPVVSAAEVEARKFGWVPQEEFKGDVNQWRDAETFLEKGKQINGFLRKDMEKIRAELAKKDSELAELKATVKEFAEFHKETEARAYERAKKELREQKKLAIQEGDGERVIEIEEQMDRLAEIDPAKKVKPAPEKTNESQQEWQAKLDAWVARNSWYSTDEDLSAYSDGVAVRLRKSNPELVGTEFLNTVEARVKAAFPQKFAKRQSAVDGGSDGTGTVRVGKGKRGYSDLPPEAKKACDKYVKQGLLTQAEYLKQYSFEE